MTNQTNKLQQILIVVLVVQVALAVWVFWPQEAASQGGGPLLADFSADEVTALTISDSNNSINLTKQGDGWVLTNADDFPANGEEVASLLEQLEAVETNRLVTETDTSHRRLQVAGDAFNRRLEISRTDGQSSEVYVGSSAGAGATHVRLGDSPEVYLTGELSPWEINPQAAGWIDTLYFTVPQTATVALTLENENGTFEFEREGESWTMAGLADDETFNEAALTTLLNQVTSVRMTEPIGQTEQPEFGLDDPQATVTLETEAESYTLRVGAESADGESYVFSASNSPYFVRVATFTGDNLIDKTRDDFIAAPPEAEGGAEAGPVESE